MRYILDTNMVSNLLREHPRVTHKIATIPMSQLHISAITGGEIWFGLAKKTHAKRLHHVMMEFFARINVLPWDKMVLPYYGNLRATLEKNGELLGGMDMLIAAHALATKAILVTNDAAFSRVPFLPIEDWTLS